MASRTRGKPRNSDDFLSDEFRIWIASGILGYSCMVLLLAMESIAVAEFALRFQLLNQLAMIGLVLSGTVALFIKALVFGWERACVMPQIALVLLLPGVQPTGSCCGNVVAFIAGHLHPMPTLIADYLPPSREANHQHANEDDCVRYTLRPRHIEAQNWLCQIDGVRTRPVNDEFYKPFNSPIS